MKKKRNNFQLLRKVMIGLLLLTIGFVFGMFVAGVAGYLTLPGYAVVPIFVFTFFLALVVHELGHFISFVSDGVQMRALFLSAFLFITENRRWTLKFRPNAMTAIGGLVVPEMGVISDEREFERMQRAYAKAIIAGPLASILLWIVAVVVTVWQFLAGEGLQSGALVFLGSLTVITLLFMVSSLFKTEALVGDFPAYTMSKNDRFFAAMQLYQYVLLSSEPQTVRRKNTFLKQVLLNELESKYRKRDIHVFTLNVVDALLVEHLVGESERLPPVVQAYIDYLLANPHILEQKNNSEIALLFRAHLIRFLAGNEQTKERAVALSDTLRRDLDSTNSTIKEYLKRQTEHVVGIADHSAYLQNIDNIRISPAHDVLKNFSGYLLDEIALNKQMIQSSTAH